MELNCQATCRENGSGEYIITIATQKQTTRASLLHALKHEFGHIVQWQRGEYRCHGIDWQKEIEASHIGWAPMALFMREFYPRMKQIPMEPPHYSGNV